MVDEPSEKAGAQAGAGSRDHAPETEDPREGRRRALLERIAEIPTDPGCYLMKDKKGGIFYVGKAANLRARLRSYFSGGDDRVFVGWLTEILHAIDTIVVRNEKEALLLERTLIKEHQPRFNILLRDDKNFIHLRLDARTPTAAEAKRARRRYPRLEVVRKPANDGARYFGPYPSASSARATLRVLNRHFQLRTCSDSVLENRKRACLQHQIGRCPAPCIVEVPDYGDRVTEAALFLGGQGQALAKRLEDRMWQASAKEDFEVAARIRDQLDAVRSSLEEQSVTEVGRRKDQDVIATNRTGSLLEVARLVIRHGGMRGVQHFSFDHQEFPTGELLLSFLGQLYGDAEAQNLPDAILLSDDLGDEAKALAIALGSRRGKRVEVKKPARGHLRRLLEIAQKNADHAMAERLKKKETQAQSLQRLQARLRLPRLPEVIECFDVSLFQGGDPVASQVVFVDGVPDKARYRLYNVRSVEGTDDFAMLYEVLTRRLKRAQSEGHFPDLLMVDGGKGQLNVAVAVCRDLGIAIQAERGAGMMLASVAKARDLGADGSGAGGRGFSGQDKVAADRQGDGARSPERIFLPGIKDPVALRPHTAERYLVERIRDEAHRFAITAHRRRRKKRTVRSALDDVPGVGPARRRALLRHLGSMKAIKAASAEEIAGTPGIGSALAKQIHEALRAGDRT
jgi:excinuclease ABC subunit C